MDFLTCGISVVALLISICGYRFNIKKKNERESPFIFLESAYHVSEKYMFPKAVGYNYNGEPQFILENRTFETSIKGETVICEPKMSLLIDTRTVEGYTERTNMQKEEIEKNTDYFVSYCDLIGINVGYPMLNFKIEFIEIYYINGGYLKIDNCNEQNIYNKYIPNGERIILSLTLIQFKNDNYTLFDANEFINQSDEIKNVYKNRDIFNSIIPNLPDKHKKIIVHITTTNIHQKEYKQKIIIETINKKKYITKSIL